MTATHHFIIHTPNGYVGQRRSMGRLYDNVTHEEAALFASFEWAQSVINNEFRNGEILPVPVVVDPDSGKRNWVEQQIIDRRAREAELLARDYD